MRATSMLAAAALSCTVLAAAEQKYGAENGKTPSPPVEKPAAPAPAPARGRMTASAQRNENVPIYLIDNNAIRESNIRLGNNVTILPDQPVEANYYAAEHGRPSTAGLLPAAAQKSSGWHGEVFWNHQSSVFNARTFFQVGSVLPSHRNQYGGRFTGNCDKLGAITGIFGQRHVRGMVNGNVLVPLPGERQSTAADPEVRSLINAWLEAYPNEYPNRPDFDPRMLNTNSPQDIDETEGALRLDQDISKPGRLSAFYNLSRQRVDAFQLVAGQNPDTQIHSHNARLAYRHAFSTATDAAFGFQFQRTRSDLVSEPNAVGPRVRMGYQIEELGPDGQFPIQRAQNSFRTGAVISHLVSGGVHTFTFGGDFYRLQMNGVESSNQRGFYSFTNNFGRSAIQNFLNGTPTTYEVSVGELHRGFRQSAVNLFFGDKFRINSRLQLYYGVRYNADGAPYEINGLTPIPYPCDCNNWAPRFSIALRLAAGWTLRTSYNLSYGSPGPVTYQQARNNTPLVKPIMVQNPDLLDPLGGINLDDPNLRTTPLWLASDLRSSYSHQYNLLLERRVFGQALLRAGYVGSRSMKLMNNYMLNRAEQVPGIPLITATVDLRRPDQRYYDVRWVVNGGIGYLDAGQVSLDMPLRRGLAYSLRYTFSKAIDHGADYSFTAANMDMQKGRSQNGNYSLEDRRGLSLFDAPHAFSLAYSYDLPKWTNGPAPARWMFNGWQFSGITTLKAGTPLTLYLGSDAPGFGNVDGGPGDRPNILDPAILGRTVGHPDTAPLILSRDRFGYLAPGVIRGSLGKSTFRKSRIGNWNAALGKEWHSSGNRELTAVLRIEAYNLTNTPQFDEPQRNLTSPSFGRITNTLNDGRIFQIGLRFLL